MTEDEMVEWHHRLNGHEFGKLQELVMDREAWCVAVHAVTKSRTQLKQLNDSKIRSSGVCRERGLASVISLENKF